MHVEEQYQEKFNSITHSPYYGCTVRVVSKVHVAYEGVLDGISTSKDRIFLKNVHVNANITVSPRRTHDNTDSTKSSTSDTLNAVMIDHLTNDIRRYEQVCLNVRDIQELRLIELPSTFHESKAKLRAIDPCLVDIRLSPSDEFVARSTSSNNNYQQRTPIARKPRGDSFGSDGRSTLISSSSNESSLSFAFHSSEKFTGEESNDESTDELIINGGQSKPVTLLAKKILPKKIERPTTMRTIHRNHHQPSLYSDQRPIINAAATRMHQQPALKKSPMPAQQNRRSSPIRVTITSKLNPNAIPFYAQQRSNRMMVPPSFTFYERTRFRPRLPTVVSPDRSQSLLCESNTIPMHQQPQTHNNHQRFVPPRQMVLRKPFMHATAPRINQRFAPTPTHMETHRINSPALSDKQFYPQQQLSKGKLSTNRQCSGFTRQASLPTSNQLQSTFPVQTNLCVTTHHRTRRSNVGIRSTTSLPFQHSNSGDCNRIQTPTSFGEPIGSRRTQRASSGASSCSSLSVDIGPHSIVQFDTSSNPFTSSEGQYDFEKANEEFRRYLELEELVTRRTSLSHCPTGSCPNDHSTTEPLPEEKSCKNGSSFFDRISCTATTGTAVAYTEMGETEKNRETFGDDVLLIASNLSDDE